MLSKVFSAAVQGIDAFLVEVELDSGRGIPSFNIVGLPDAAVKESRDRVKAAILNSGLEFPANIRFTANLAPADVRKEGPAFDLPLALSVLAALGASSRRKIKGLRLRGRAFAGRRAARIAGRLAHGGPRQERGQEALCRA